VASRDPAGWSLILSIQRATHLTLEALSKRLAHLGLTPGEINALANLADGEGRTVSELSRQVGTPLTTMTSMLDRLTRRDLISRRTPESNRRTVVITLTTSGLPIAREARRAIDELELELVSDLSDRQLTQLRHALELLGTERSG
jgi:DNA-binding MarR family transcriptional regulator